MVRPGAQTSGMAMITQHPLIIGKSKNRERLDPSHPNLFRLSCLLKGLSDSVQRYTFVHTPHISNIAQREVCTPLKYV